jgi:hypothetical protein
METLSFILLVGCVIAIVVAMAIHSVKTYNHNNHNYNHNHNYNQQQTATTLARLDFEDAERALAKAKLILSIVQNSPNVREPVLDKAMEQVEVVAEEWVRSLKQVLQMRRRYRSPSPESKAIYDRFRPKINTVESN